MVKTTALEETLDLVALLNRNNVSKIEKVELLTRRKISLESTNQKLKLEGKLLESIDVDTAIYFIEKEQARLCI